MNATLAENMTSLSPNKSDLSNFTFISNNGRKDTFFTELTLHQTYVVAKMINNYKFYFLMVFAIVGNGLSIFAVRRRTGTSSSCFYIVNLAVCDNLVILSKGVYFLLTLFDIDLGHWGCKILIYIMNVSLYYSVWLVVIMTGERFVAIVWPLKVMAWINIQRAKLMLVVLYITLTAFGSVYLVVVTSIKYDGFAVCAPLDKYTNFYDKTWLVVEVIVITYIPLILILLLNIFMIVKLKEARRKQASLRRESQINSGQVTAMLLTVSITFFLLTSPYSFFVISVKQGIWDYKATPYSYSVYLIISTILRLLADLNHCINFLLYVASAKSFRQEIRKLYPCSEKPNASNIQRNSSTMLSVVTTTIR